MDYLFRFGAADTSVLLPQVRHALKKRAELFPSPDRSKKRKSALPFLLSAIPTAAGGVLLALGAVTPKKRKACYAVGSAGIAAVAGTLLLGLGLRKDPLQEEARLLLERLADLPQDQTVQAVFSSAAMILMNSTEARTILYHDISHVIEEEDLFLLTHGEQTSILLKQDLVGDLDAFCDFIGDKTILI